MNNVDEQYLNILNDIISNGFEKETRSGLVKSVFDRTMRFNLKNGFPLLTTKKVFTKGMIHELLWFIKGDTNIKYLIDNNVNIWNDDAYRYYIELMRSHNKRVNEYDCGIVEFSILEQEDFFELVKKGSSILIMFKTNNAWSCKTYVFGDLGDVYGKQWRRYGISGVDQIKGLIEALKHNPDDRRIILSGWNPDVIDEIALPACHMFSVFYSRKLTMNERWELYYEKFKDEKPNSMNFSCEHLEKYGESKTFNYNGMFDEELDKENIPFRELSCSFTCRSQDFPLGTPINIASYALLTHMIAQCVNMSVGELVYHGMDCHVYINQIESVNEQLIRDPKKHDLPTLKLNENIVNIDDFKYDDIKIENYESYPTIKFPLSVGL